MELAVKNLEGQVLSQVQVSDAVFGIPMNTAVVHQVMVAELANRRLGTHDTKTRAEVHGGGRKPWAQKHTGRARQGSTRSPQWRHGGVVWGPHPRDYHLDTPRRVRHLARRCLLSEKARADQITVVESLSVANGKTKELKGVLATLGIQHKCLVVTGTSSPLVLRAAKNLPMVRAIAAHTLSTLDLLDYDHLLITVDGVKKVEELWAQERPRRTVRRLASPSGEQPAPAAP
ncbi:MAG: 50S ribosomal protein L4 [Chloroflexi bacterium]|nr:50S ribosomal protein L4 [Chloroflexota bacterium]